MKLDKTNNPFIKAKINGKTETFLLDFGYGGLISLTERVGKNITFQDKVEIIGEGSISANGILKESTFITAIENFKIGNVNLENQIAYYSKSNNYNLIGSGITKHFIVTLNFKNKELFLTPIKNKEVLKPRLSFGFDLNRNEKNVYVNKIHKGSLAEKSGLKLNDNIVFINDLKMTQDSEYCNFYSKKNKILRSKNAIQLTIKRKNKLLKLEFIKSNVF